MARNQKATDEGMKASKRPRRASANGNGAASDEEIARRAYEIYQNRGGTDGADLDDWLEAERQLRPGPSDVTGPQAKPRRRAKETTAV